MNKDRNCHEQKSFSKWLFLHTRTKENLIRKPDTLKVPSVHLLPFPSSSKSCFFQVFSAPLSTPIVWAHRHGMHRPWDWYWPGDERVTKNSHSHGKEGYSFYKMETYHPSGQLAAFFQLWGTSAMSMESLAQWKGPELGENWVTESINQGPTYHLLYF